MAVFLGPVGDDPQAVEVKRLGIRPGDVLVLKLDHEPFPDEFGEIKKAVDYVFRDADYRPPVMILGPGMEIGVVGPDEVPLCRR